MYNDIVLDHFANPRNVGVLSQADGIGRSGNPVDGDSFTIYIKVHNGTLKDVRFKTFGCGAAIAASSMLTVLAEGKSLEDAMNITNENVAEALGGLPPKKLLCSNFAADALRDAIEDYRKNKQYNTEVINSEENIPEEPSSVNEGLKDKKQIERYLRHIIIPKISGAGQKKLLETNALVYAESIETCDVLLCYMASSGIGHIYLYLQDKDKYESVLMHVHDLNPEINIELAGSPDQLNNQINIDFRILIGEYDFINKINNLFNKQNSDIFIPLFIFNAYAWRGCFSLCKDNKSVQEFLTKLSENQIFEKMSADKHFDKLGLSMSYAFMETLAVIELIKIRLNIGNVPADIKYFNMLENSYCNDISKSEYKIKLNNQIENRLSKAKVLIIGTGGLGCPAALALTKAGIGTIGLIDYDDVDLSNLNRQILHTTSRIGMKKVESAKKTLKKVNPETNIEIYPAAFSRENAMDIIKKYDIIVDGLDNLPTRYLLNDACFFAKKPLVEAGALAFYGQVTSIIPEDGPCYRCIFKEDPERNSPGCNEVGILGPVPGLIGILEALETIKVIIGIDSDLKGGLLMYDALESDFNLIEFKKDSSCPLCGDHPSINQLGDYTFVCKDKK